MTLAINFGSKNVLRPHSSPVVYKPLFLGLCDDATYQNIGGISIPPEFGSTTLIEPSTVEVRQAIRAEFE